MRWKMSWFQVNLDVDYRKVISIIKQVSTDLLSLKSWSYFVWLQVTENRNTYTTLSRQVLQVLSSGSVPRGADWVLLLGGGVVNSSVFDVAAGVCYRGMPRKGDGDQSRLGGNKLSWCLGYYQHPSSAADLSAEHDNQRHDSPVPSAFARLGVYLDWSAGTLSYYNVSSDTLSHI